MAVGREAITVAAAQLTARLMNEAPRTLASIEGAIQRAAGKRVDLLVLPESAYPAYLIGSIDSYREGDHLTGEQYVAWLAEQARRHRLHLISGFVEDPPDRLYNAAVFIDDQGREIGRARKRFLWHMDQEWFTPGETIEAFDSALGRVGIVTCAETRAPEIVATLVADGAEILAMPTCWINAASEPGQYYNIQVDYLIEARAREFDVPFVCADKSGFELGKVGYVGQSRIVRADGSVAAEAPTTGETVVAARLVPHPPRRLWMSDARRKRLLDPAPARRPEGGSARRVTLAAMPTHVANQRFEGGMGESLFEPLAWRGVGLLMVNMSTDQAAEQLQMLGRAFDIHAIGFPHRADAFPLGPARVGCVAGQWSRSFAAARSLALDGAEVLFFFDVPRDLPMLRTRAVENRVFVAGAGDRWAVVIGPDGRVLGQSDTHQPHETVVEIDLAEAADKNVAPRTDVFNERRAGLYRF